jgi:exopolyphosphatase/guanosine-5'-triphosphate,3'-diphosphate pyrophosphatase
MNKLCAAIDLGTNTARLLIADSVRNGSFRHIRIEREIVRMGGGFSRETGLSPDAVQRGISCLKRFSEIMKSYQLASLRAVATSAIRDALNGSQFVEEVLTQTGIPLTVIDGDMEGALTLSGVIAGLDKQYDNLLVFDVGGGSTEYTVARHGAAEFIRSLPLGVVRLTEGKDNLDQMAVKIHKELGFLAEELTKSGTRIAPECTTLVGTAGTATTLAAISLRMNDYDYRRVNNTVLELEEIRRIYSLLLPLSLAERLKLPGLEKGREDLIIAGILITLQTMQLLGFTRLHVSDYGLLEGLIVSDALPDM